MGSWERRRPSLSWEGKVEQYLRDGIGGELSGRGWKRENTHVKWKSGGPAIAYLEVGCFLVEEGNKDCVSSFINEQ